MHTCFITYYQQSDFYTQQELTYNQGSLKVRLIMFTAMRKLLELFIPPPQKVLEEASYLLKYF